MQAELSLALQQHQRGCLDEAARLYQNILVVRPDDSEALHLLGVVAHQQARHDQAIQIIGRAIALERVHVPLVDRMTAFEVGQLRPGSLPRFRFDGCDLSDDRLAYIQAMLGNCHVVRHPERSEPPSR